MTDTKIILVLSHSWKGFKSRVNKYSQGIKPEHINLTERTITTSDGTIKFWFWMVDNAEMIMATIPHKVLETKDFCENVNAHKIKAVAMYRMTKFRENKI